MKPSKIVWQSKAIIQFAKAIEYIYKDSPQNALLVKDNIEKIVDSLFEYPERFAPDKYKNNNDKSEYRAFEKHHLRISYRFYNSTIRIIRVKHTRQNPQSY